jgi:hypothetical protein
MYDTAEILKLRFGPTTFFLKGISRKNIYREISSYHALTLNKKSWGIIYFIFGFSRVIAPTDTDFEDFRSDYLGEYEAICETALARESGP